jgi:hypothetical protein
LRETIVAAVVTGEIGAQRYGVDAVDFTDPGCELDGFEAAGREAAAPPAQGRERRVESAAYAAGRGVCRKQEWFHCDTWTWGVDDRC